MSEEKSGIKLQSNRDTARWMFKLVMEWQFPDSNRQSGIMMDVNFNQFEAWLASKDITFLEEGSK